jgi:hypothetical protein
MNQLCECAANLNVQDDASSGGQSLPALVISEISPGNYIELFNTTNAAIDLSMNSYEFCSPFDYHSVANLAMMNLTTVAPAKGFYVLSWPMGFTDTTLGGEILLFADNMFANNNKIMDFVCWGNNPHDSRLSQALAVGKWDMNSSCVNAAVMAKGALHRKVGTTGITEANYDFASDPSGMSCASP